VARVPSSNWRVEWKDLPLTTKGTKYTKGINNQEADDLLEFNTRRGMYAGISCPTPTSIVIRQVLLAGLQLRGANHPSLGTSPFRVFRPFRGKNSDHLHVWTKDTTRDS